MGLSSRVFACALLLQVHFVCSATNKILGRSRRNRATSSDVDMCVTDEEWKSSTVSKVVRTTAFCLSTVPSQRPLSSSLAVPRLCPAMGEHCYSAKSTSKPRRKVNCGYGTKHKGRGVY
ncbi:hypothetical protein QBC35DRAFT_48001 [Podospora australis]|uniref:Secreted protein n=1 Tax=Podospora australis TaxID=1536484 RepID=A0AAN6WNM0_9PEZI|nr:hypothetical protein QBC35DRAFT_48001 [Podospora australis]